MADHARVRVAGDELGGYIRAIRGIDLPSNRYVQRVE
jgi:hypothetical protein